MFNQLTYDNNLCFVSSIDKKYRKLYNNTYYYTISNFLKNTHTYYYKPCVRENWKLHYITRLSVLLGTQIYILKFCLQKIDDPIVRFHVLQTKFENMYRVLSNMGNLIMEFTRFLCTRTVYV